MAIINILSAILVLLGGFLCGRAFLPHIDIFGGRPTENLARGLLICAMSTFPRAAWRELVKPLVAGPHHPFQMIDLGFNVILLIGVYFILRARWLTIPEDERYRYNIITAVFYPKNIIPRLRRDE